MCCSVSKNILKSKQEGIVQVFKNISFMFILIYSFQFRNIYLLSLLISLRSSRFLSFSKRSRKTAKEWQNKQICKHSSILTHPLPTSPQFFGPPQACSFARPLFVRLFNLPAA